MTAMMTTSDNIPLSEPISHQETTGFAINCTDTKVLEFLRAAHAPNTRRAYQSDLAQFIAWGGAVPATPLLVARYLADHATTLSMATLARRLVTISVAHKARGFPNPAATELVRLTFRGIRRSYGRPQRRIAALTKEDLVTIVTRLGNSPRDLRDRALLLIGFAGAFRRSELIAIDCKFIVRTSKGIVVTLPRSKTDQDGQGRKVIIPFGRDPTCPIDAINRWLEISAVTDGPIFRSLTKGGGVSGARISAEAVAIIVKQRAATIGLDPTLYSGHSLRAGFATSGAAAGIPLWKLRSQTGHSSNETLCRYIRDREICAGKGLC